MLAADSRGRRQGRRRDVAEQGPFSCFVFTGVYLIIRSDSGIWVPRP